MAQRLSSTDRGYRVGDLSVFPEALDTSETLFEVTNNAETALKHSISPSSKFLTVEDASRFPNSGLLKVQHASLLGVWEFIYYSRKVGQQFHYLNRGFGNTRQSSWQAGSKVTAPLMAEHINALRDAIVRIERKVGLADSNDPNTLTGLLRELERKWLAPKPVFRAYPRTGPAPLDVRFQNFSSGHGVRFLWDFGDGATSTERCPTHTYEKTGAYTVRLTMVSSTQAQGSAEKSSYINVVGEANEVFFYPEPLTGTSRQTSPESPTQFTFIDQTKANVLERHWLFGDGQELVESDPHVHTAVHTYDLPGSYRPALVLRLEGGRLRRATAEGVYAE